jgi:lipoprotein-releasing system permease protein
VIPFQKKPVVFIAVRFLFENKRALIFSCLGVILGVGFFVCGQALTKGFQKYFVQSMLGTRGAIEIKDRFQSSYTNLLEKREAKTISLTNPQSRKYYPGIADADRVMKTVYEYPNVSALTPIIQGNVVLRSSFRNEVCELYGIDLNYHLKATDFAKQIIEGQLEDFRANPSSIIIGSLLAQRLELKVGQNVYLISPGNVSRRFKVACIYESGMNVIDEKRVYLQFRVAQTVLQKPHETSFILIKLKDPERAPEDALALEELLSHTARSWQDREKNNLQIFYTFRLSAGVVISFVIMLAACGIFNVLTMSVLEKTKEIAILRSMGYSQRDISSIFLWQGMIIAVVGIVLGWILGTGLTLAVSQIPIKIRGIFKADTFMVDWSPDYFIYGALLALISVLGASYIPAKRAARTEPVKILRGTSQ